MPRRLETWVALCNLMLKHCIISRSSTILGSDSPQKNNRKDNSFWITPFIPRERPNVKHAIAGYLRLPQPTSAPALMQELHWLRCTLMATLCNDNRGRRMHTGSLANRKVWPASRACAESNCIHIIFNKVCVGVYLVRNRPDTHLVVFLRNYPNKVVVAVNHCFTSLFGTQGLLSDIVIR